MHRMTDACENITLPQTLFAGGNKINYTEQPEEKVYINHVISNFHLVTR